MPAIQKVVSVAASSVNDNVLSGSQYEFLPYNALVEFGFCQSATGLVLDVFSGADCVAEAFEPVIRAGYPLYPDDFGLTDVARGGERLKVRVRNTTVGALSIYLGVKISPA